ncbi:hypothetical protein ACFOWM_05045 [Ferruginibacter yonginensis]|uniref:Outer membrane protein beta-barrel domain-containing protein n=1 Tax=Ferruginibacter yonginensis TaxID=1310416 RepID=A0ABV8QPM6_9BACT
MRKFLHAIVALLIFTCLHFVAAAQSLRYSVSMPYIGLGAYTTKQNDAFSFTSNQAALAQTKAASVGVYGERRFLLADNSVYGLALAIPTSLGNFGIQANYAGFANFNEQKVGVAYGRSLGSKLDIGVQFNYYGYRIPTYNSASAVNFEAGAIMHVSEKLNVGVHVYNPVGGNLGKSGNEKIASAYKFGVGYDVSDNFYFSTEIIKEEDQPVNVTGGFQYRFKKQFFAKAGFRSDNNTGYAGIGFQYDAIRIDVAASYHQQLGVSPGVLLIYNFKEAKK